MIDHHPPGPAYSRPRSNARVLVASVGALVEYRLTLALVALMRALLVAVAATAAIAAAYLVKSALGIDLMAGPSPLHDLLYPLIRG